MITLKSVCKTFKVAKRKGGLLNAARALFSRDYEYIRALDEVSFNINEGEMVGYIGPNGAGKSSTIKIMSGILHPDGGECTINGRTPWKDRIRHVAEIGVVFGQRSQLWWDVPVSDSFELLRDIYKIDAATFKQNYNELIEQLNISSIVNIPTRQLSLGQRMRCEIAASLLHSPAILFLDEPTIGLDAVSKLALRDFLKSLNKFKKTTIILTTHDMQDIEALTPRIILIGKGRVLLDDNIETIKRKYDNVKQLTVEYSSGTPTIVNGMTFLETIPGRVIVAVDPAIISVNAAISAISTGCEISDIAVSGAKLEDVVVKLYHEHNI